VKNKKRKISTKKNGGAAKAVAVKNKKTAHQIWQRFLVFSIISISLFGVLAAGFFSLAHGSLTKIYLGSLPVQATDNQAELQQKVANAAKNYALTVQYPDGSKKSYALADIGVSIDSFSSAQKAKGSVNKDLLQRLEWWKPIKLPLVTKSNVPALSAFISNSATQITLAPKDAILATTNGAVALTPETAGKGATIENAKQAIPAAIANLQAKPLVLKAAVLQANITSNDLKNSQDKVNSLLSQKVTFNVANHEVTAGKTDIAGWIELSPVPKTKTVDVNVDSGKVLNYINKIAGPYIQPPRSRLVTNTDSGQVVLDAGANGIDVVNKNQTAADVAKKLLEGKGIKIDLSIKYATAQAIEVQPYDKWLIADVTTKRMYAYEGTNLVRTFLVSAGAPKTPTVLGKYAIYAKYKSQDMTGANADGSRYSQPDVPYVNYFYKDYAVHGNYWRPGSYFGNINSSHGCIGINVSDSKWIYDWAPIGTPVIVHT
jgi:lipoprotein-anchoring transpeptidase ErfK/SrfK